VNEETQCIARELVNKRKVWNVVHGMYDIIKKNLLFIYLSSENSAKLLCLLQRFLQTCLILDTLKADVNLDYTLNFGFYLTENTVFH